MNMRMIMIIVAVCSIAIGSVSQAATKIDGTVTDMNGNPVSGADVKLFNIKKQIVDNTATDDKGKFMLKKIPNSIYIIEITKEGFNKHEKQIDYENASSGNVDIMEVTLYQPASALAKQAGSELNQFYLPADYKIDTEALKEFEKGMKKDEQKDNEGALKHFIAATEKDPTFSRAFTFVGIEKQRAGDMAAAKENFTKAIELNPKDPIPYVNLGGLLNAEKNFAEAIKHLEKAVELDPVIAKAYLFLGQTYYNNGQYDKAVPALQKVTSLEPQNYPVAFGVLGNAFVKLQDYRQAREAFKQFVELDPQNPNVNSIKETIKKLDEALNTQSQKKQTP